MISLPRLAELAAEAYGPSPDIQCSGDIAANVIDESGALVVACRGTVISDLDNVATDLRALPRWRSGAGLVHPGFWDAAHEIWCEVRAKVTSSEYAICFVGHSLGAAMAICLAAMTAEFGRRSTVLALAPPRVGGLHLRWALQNEAIYLVRRANDAVPLVPFLPPIYLHPRPLIHINPDEVEELVSAHSVDKYVAEFSDYVQSGGLNE